MEKLSVKEATATRVELYGIATAALDAQGFVTEPIKGGSLVDLGNGYFAKLTISVCDASKLDVDALRAEYTEAVEKRAAKAVEAQAKAAVKAAKAAEREAAKEAKEAAKVEA